MSVPPRLDLLQVSALVGARQYEKLRNKSVEPTRSFLGIIERGAAQRCHSRQAGPGLDEYAGWSVRTMPWECPAYWDCQQSQRACEKP
jgi:hypothetical protein